jgi:putative addiction module component (TIGR02574 family)
MARISVADILQLPVAERLRLVEAIWDSIVESPEAVELTDAQRAELDRRWEAFEDNPSEGSPWPKVRARIQKGK